MVLIPSEWPPLIQVFVEPKARSDRDRLRAALNSAMASDPALRVVDEPEHEIFIVQGSSELHLDVVIDRLQREFGIALKLGAPQVAYRETISRRHEQDYTHKRLSNSVGQFAHVKLTFEPNGGRYDSAFESRVPAGAVPAEFVSAVENGVATVLVSGPFAGFPVIGVKTTLIDAAFHQTDSSPQAFELAARGAFREAASKLGFYLLEPVMKVEVVAAKDCAAAVASDLRRRRGQVTRQTAHGDDEASIAATAPLANLFKFQDDLRTISRGRARFRMSPDHYAPVPGSFDDGDPPLAVVVA